MKCMCSFKLQLFLNLIQIDMYIIHFTALI